VYELMMKYRFSVDGCKQRRAAQSAAGQFQTRNPIIRQVAPSDGTAGCRT